MSLDDSPTPKSKYGRKVNAYCELQPQDSGVADMLAPANAAGLTDATNVNQNFPMEGNIPGLKHTVSGTAAERHEQQLLNALYAQATEKYRRNAQTLKEVYTHGLAQRAASLHQAVPDTQAAEFGPIGSAAALAAPVTTTSGYSAVTSTQREASFGAARNDDKVSPDRSQRSAEDYEKEILNLKLALAKARISQLEEEVSNPTESHVTKHTLNHIVSASDCDGDFVRDRDELDTSSKHTSPAEPTGSGPWGNTPFLPGNPTVAARAVNPALGYPINPVGNAQQAQYSLPAKPTFPSYVPQHSAAYSGQPNGWAYPTAPMNAPRAPAAMMAGPGTSGANPGLGRGAPTFNGQGIGRDFQGPFPNVQQPNFPGEGPRFVPGNGVNGGFNQASAHYAAQRGSLSAKGYTGPMVPHSYAMTAAPMIQPVGSWDLVKANTQAAVHKAKDPWGNSADSLETTADGTKYISPQDPINYRTLLEKNATTDWKIIVGKIVDFNDQQASIFLQQKLKSGTDQQKHDIIDAILGSAYGLMVNRFGNFLVQRCFEHGTDEQIRRLADSIRGHTLALSQDPFGCHVVQKAFDCVTEDYKALMIHELLRKIPETVTHRYACHVWQKLFELRWSGAPPQIMKYVNDALCGMWDKVAMGETGSLVVQNVFENCLEEEKRPCVNEVLANIDPICKGQFGNWCIQHICEHGAAADKAAAVDHVLAHAKDYSLHQYASKVVEKCLKINVNNFIDRYLDIVCEPREDRVRMPLIDISSDQFGNYLVQYILQNCTSRQREIVSTHIRKHMVSLRGNKYGSRVAMLCCNPASNWQSRANRDGSRGTMSSRSHFD